MPMDQPDRIAIVHEWLEARAGSEKVVEQMLALFPQADLFTLVKFFAAEAPPRIPLAQAFRPPSSSNCPGLRATFASICPSCPWRSSSLTWPPTT